MKETTLINSILVLTVSTIVLGCATRNLAVEEHHSQLIEIPQRSINTTQIIERLAFGSCNRTDLPQILWDDIKSQKPDIWLWLGDNVYADTDDTYKLSKEYNKQLAVKGYQELAKETMILGIWDDHDYGLNDGGKEFQGKRITKSFMLDFLKVAPDHPVRLRDGAYQSYTFGSGSEKVKIILLDTRSFRDPIERIDGEYQINDTGTILGDEQWLWLENEVKNSDAQINIIANGVQFIPTEHRFEKWANFPHERNRLFDLLAESGTQRPIFLSGDRHTSEIMELEWKNSRLIEITSSGLTHPYNRSDGERNQYRQGPLITEHSFGVMHIDWSEGQPQITISLEGDGKEIFEFSY